MTNLASVAARLAELCEVARFAIDTNRINARQQLPSMNRLEHFAEEGFVELLMPEEAAGEAVRGSTLRAAKARAYIQTMGVHTMPDERAWFDQIADVLFAGDLNARGRREDVLIVFNAHKYGAILVTSDGGSKRQPGGILGARTELFALGIRVITDEGAVAHVESRLRARVKTALDVARLHELPAPEWVSRVQRCIGP